ncbi:MAG TPA: hypothetical protein VF039_11845, partial [Longimicrobiales bacterium]
RLTHGAVHVRALEAQGGLAEDTMLQLEFSGHSQVFDDTVPNDVLTISEYHPFQLQFEEEGRSFFRPAWSPDGRLLAVSDGLHVYVWDPRTGAITLLPASTDAFMPAWSPDGEWIAFARHERVAAQVIVCEYIFNGGHACNERRVIHHFAEPRIVLVRADGTEVVELGVQGTDPAWSPDGRFLYVSSPYSGYRAIARVDVETAEVLFVEGTETGIEPAVSPDGRRIAFARPGNAGFDIWLVNAP